MVTAYVFTATMGCLDIFRVATVIGPCSFSGGFFLYTSTRETDPIHSFLQSWPSGGSPKPGARNLATCLPLLVAETQFPGPLFAVSQARQWQDAGTGS